MPCRAALGSCSTPGRFPQQQIQFPGDQSFRLLLDDAFSIASKSMCPGVGSFVVGPIEARHDKRG